MEFDQTPSEDIGEGWIGFDDWTGGEGAIRLDGRFTVAQLEALIRFLKSIDC